MLLLVQWMPKEESKDTSTNDLMWSWACIVGWFDYTQLLRTEDGKKAMHSIQYNDIRLPQLLAV